MDRNYRCDFYHSWEGDEKDVNGHRGSKCLT
jgi:hypothetical protein